MGFENQLRLLAAASRRFDFLRIYRWSYLRQVAARFGAI
jgi:hypothetical protein